MSDDIHPEGGTDRRHFLGVAALGFAASRFGFLGNERRNRAPADGELRSLGQATAWLNSQPLTASSLRGKVVAVDFWTFTCVNWLRTLPYLRAWADKYGNQNLIVIGAHAPEFPFERNVENVRREAKTLRVDYPIAIDNDFAIWRAFKNEYWPGLYLIDAQGRVRYHQFGEGEYAQSERVIQQLLTEAGHRGVEEQIAAVEPRGGEVAADWNNLGSQETYVGYERAENFASPGGASIDAPHVYRPPERLALNHWAAHRRLDDIQAGGFVECGEGRRCNLVSCP
ncbi:MAG TPA: redoxin domain-containing protein [Gemmatimonadaceae bacterium]